MMRLALYVGLGGFFGSIGRFLISQWLVKIFPNFQPSGTLVVNILGCFILGFLIHFSGKLDRDTYLLLTTGFCGGFTTFSAFSMENINLLTEGNYGTASIYIVLSLVLGLAGYFGWYIGKTLMV